MLLRRDEHGVLAISQASHAWISGQLARAWGNNRFPSPDPWEEVCLAAEQHDIGMAEWDLKPARDPATGLPYSFMEMRLADHVGLWAAAPRKLLAQSRYAALLVSMHGWRLYRRRDLEALSAPDAELVRAYLSAQEELRRQLVSSLMRDREAFAREAVIARNSQLIWIWDFISLVLCLDWAPRPIHEAPGFGGPIELSLAPAGQPRQLSLEPWPFREERFVVRCEGRRLEGPYDSDEALDEALRAAAWETLEFELVDRS